MRCPSFSERPAAPGICRCSPRGGVPRHAPGWGRWTREFPRSVTCRSDGEGKLAAVLVRGGHGRRRPGLTTATRCEAASDLAAAGFLNWMANSDVGCRGSTILQFRSSGDLEICVASALLATSLLVGGAALVCTTRWDLFVGDDRRS